MALPIRECMKDKDWMTVSLMSNRAVNNCPKDPENWFNAAIVQIHLDNILGANQ